LIFAGYEFDDQVDPSRRASGSPSISARTDDFVGRTALEERSRTPSACWSGSSSRGTRQPVTATRSTSAASASASSRAGRVARSSKKNIALCPRSRCSTRSSDTKLEVGKLDGQQKRIPATVVRFPFYDPDKTRPRS
jgi:aminomethyltransferase